jgi:hypothetical protein
MQIIKTILESDYFAAEPPVLVDIGASGEINPKWKAIASYSICIAFDADDREFNVTEVVNKHYKKLITFNRIVTAGRPNEQADFYLTTSPFCSSLLQPDEEKLACWAFRDLFKIDRVAKLHTITLSKALSQTNIDYIDWFKADTQGTDLQLLNSLPEQIQSGILSVELEPGILDAYKGEDKLYSVMQKMHNDLYWLSAMKIKGTQRFPSKYQHYIRSFIGKRTIRDSPGWAELTYLKQPTVSSVRQLLLLYVFALLEKQYGFALEVADLGVQAYEHEIFAQCREAVLRKITTEKIKAPLVMAKRKLNKLFSSVND